MDILGRTAWSSSWSPGQTGTCTAADRNLPLSRPDGTLSHPRCGPYQTTPPQGPFRRVSSACLEVSHLPGQDAPLLQNPQLIVLRTKPFDGFIVPKFTAGPNNFRAGRECRAGRLREANGPGSRQEIATSKSAGPGLPLKASTCRVGAGPAISGPECHG